MKPMTAAFILLVLAEFLTIFRGVSDNSDWAGTMILVAIVWAIYYLPVIVAYVRHRLNSGPIFVIVFFLGWTVIGWIVALAMAAGGTTQKQVNRTV